MPLPEGVISFIEAGLSRVPGVVSARLRLEVVPVTGDADAEEAGARRTWVETLNARYGWLDLVISDEDAFASYEPYVTNLLNDVAMHVEGVHQRARLERLLAEAHEAERRKDEFLGVLSHELRNPLAPIRNSIYVLKRAQPGSPQAVRATEVIERQTEHLTRLVDDLLDAKRLSTGKFRLHSLRIDLAKVIRDTVEDLRPMLARRSIALALDTPAAAVWVNGDATRLAQVVGNLLHNAAKFTNGGGHVVVAVAPRRDRVDVRVRDDGVGVSPDLLPTVFEPFVQSENTIHRTRGGLGLGLALVRGITELHGGSVAVHSEGVGKGAEFTVTLPTAEPAVAAPSTAVPEAGGCARRILVVEDNRDAAESLRDVLTHVGGHEVHVAHDGERAVAAAREHVPDVVLCDLGLPVIDGYEVARRIREAPGAESRARLVALSGYAAPEDVERSLRAGFDYHVAKPPALERLLKLVAEAPSPRAAPSLPDSIATGHHEVDEQHAAMLAEAARLRHAPTDAVWASLRFLQHHTTSHFEYEEKLMDDVGYPRASLHQEQHVAFVAELLRFRERLKRDGATEASLSALATAVESWVTEHVLDEDRRLAEFIRQRHAEAA